MCDYASLSIPELLEEEEKATKRRNMCTRDSNTWRQCDAKIERILAELKSRAEQAEKLH
jgi:hypothetical protein